MAWRRCWKSIREEAATAPSQPDSPPAHKILKKSPRRALFLEYTL